MRLKNSIASIYLAISVLLFSPLQYSLAEQSAAKPEVSNVASGSHDVEVLITKTPIVLKSYLGKKYNGYNISLKNQTDVPLELVSTDVTLGMSGPQVYNAARKRSGTSLAGILGGGAISGLVTFGIGFAVSLIIAPIYCGIKHSQNKKARQESVQFSNKLPSGEFKPGAEFSFSTLVPLGTPAYIEATIKNPSTGKVFVVSK